MKRKAILAIVVVTISFSIGYLTYFGTTLLVDFLEGQFADCDKQTHACEHQETDNINY